MAMMGSSAARVGAVLAAFLILVLATGPSLDGLICSADGLSPSHRQTASIQAVSSAERSVAHSDHDGSTGGAAVCTHGHAHTASGYICTAAEFGPSSPVIALLYRIPDHRLPPAAAAGPLERPPRA